MDRRLQGRPVLRHQWPDALPGSGRQGSGRRNPPDRPAFRECEVRAQSPIVPMGVLQLIVNGEVVATAKPSADEAAEIDQPVRIGRSSWIAARIRGDGHRLVVNDPKVFAHTCPVYCYVNNQRIAFPEDAKIAVAWIDRLIQDVFASPRFSHEAKRNKVIALFRKAQRYYQEIR